MSEQNSHQSELKYQKRISTSLGIIYLVVSEKYLYAALWTSAEQRTELQPVVTEKSTVIPKAALKIMKNTEQQINEFLNGERRDFDLPLRFGGTRFQSKVWKQLKKIPFGKTLSYKKLAAKVGSPKAYRAVGSANRCNPLSLIVPCHRVINEGGALGGYAGGLENKRKLLEMESNKFAGF